MNDVQDANRSGSETRQRQRRITFRLATHEYSELETKAQKAGVTLGSFIRVAVLDVPTTRTTRRPSIERELLAQAAAQLGRIGGNLHQIAKRLNFGDVEYAADLPAAIAEFREAVALLMRAAGRVPRGD